MTEDRAEYLASGQGPRPVDGDRLDLVRDVLSRETTWAEPPPEVADRVFAAIRSQTPTEEKIPSRSRWSGVVAAVLGVAAIATVVAGVAGVFSPTEEQVIAMEGTELQPAASGEAAIRATDAGWWIRLDITDLPPADAGTYYEGWVWNDEGEGVSIGTFHLRGEDGSVTMWSGVDPADYPAIWVTLEDEDGDPSASERIVMWGRP